MSATCWTAADSRVVDHLMQEQAEGGHGSCAGQSRPFLPRLRQPDWIDAGLEFGRALAEPSGAGGCRETLTSYGIDFDGDHHRTHAEVLRLVPGRICAGS